MSYLKTCSDPGDEVITFAPYFGEYRAYTSNYDGVLVEISPDTTIFQPKSRRVRSKDHAEDEGGHHQYAKQSNRSGLFRGDHQEDGGYYGGRSRRNTEQTSI